MTQHLLEPRRSDKAPSPKQTVLTVVFCLPSGELFQMTNPSVILMIRQSNRRDAVLPYQPPRRSSSGVLPLVWSVRSQSIGILNSPILLPEASFAAFLSQLRINTAKVRPCSGTTPGAVKTNAFVANTSLCRRTGMEAPRRLKDKSLRGKRTMFRLNSWYCENAHSRGANAGLVCSAVGKGGAGCIAN